MTPHTPGPWGIVTAAKYGADHDHPAVIKDEGDGIPWCVIAARVTGPDLHQARANARLIAAAPRMWDFVLAFIENRASFTEAEEIRKAVNG